MALTHLNYIALSAAAAATWIVAVCCHNLHLRRDFDSWASESSAIFIAVQAVSGVIAIGSAFAFSVLLRAAGVPSQPIAVGQLVLAALSLSLAIWWQMGVFRTANPESLSVNIAAGANSSTAMVIAAAAFAPYGHIVGSLMADVGDPRFWLPTVLFIAGVLLYMFITRQGRKRWQQANDNAKRQPLHND